VTNRPVWRAGILLFLQHGREAIEDKGENLKRDGVSVPPRLLNGLCRRGAPGEKFAGCSLGNPFLFQFNLIVRVRKGSMGVRGL